MKKRQAGEQYVQSNTIYMEFQNIQYYHTVLIYIVNFFFNTPVPKVQPVPEEQLCNCVIFQIGFMCLCKKKSI